MQYEKGKVYMKELKKSWKNKEFKKCYLFFGAEKYLIKNYEKILIDELLTQESQMMNLDIFEEEKAQVNTILDVAETLPFLDDKRLIIVRNSQFFKKGSRKEEGVKLIPYMENLPESCCILFIEDKVEKNNLLYKAVMQYGMAIEFKPLGEKDLLTWIKREIKNSGLIISDKVIQYFLQITNQDMDAIKGELEKLISFKGQGGEFFIEDIDQVCSVSIEAKVFDLVRAVAEGQGRKASLIYRNMLTLKESPYTVFYLITSQFRNMLLVTLFQEEGHTNQDIAKRLELRDFAVRQYGTQGKRFSKEGLKKALKECLEVDLKIKMGIMGEETAVELFIMKYSCGL